MLVFLICAELRVKSKQTSMHTPGSFPCRYGGVRVRARRRHLPQRPELHAQLQVPVCLREWRHWLRGAVHGVAAAARVVPDATAGQSPGTVLREVDLRRAQKGAQDCAATRHRG